MISHADEVMSEMDRKKRAALEAIGTTCVAASVRIVTQEGRVDSDKMRGSISYQTDADKCIVGTNTRYAIYNEIGTGVYVPGGRKSPWAYKDEKGKWHRTTGMRGIHFIKNGVANNVKKIQAIIKRIMSE